jgi:hypothetical protein
LEKYVVALGYELVLAAPKPSPKRPRPPQRRPPQRKKKTG